jgi:hypothetical protein
MKKINWTDNTDIRLGFEIECVIRGGSEWRKFCDAIRPLRRVLSTGSDGSINTRGVPGGRTYRDIYGGYSDGGRNSPRGVEIRTVPLPTKSAMELLEKVFAIVNKYGITNASCGFHVNISSAKKAKMRDFNPLPFLSCKLWNQILQKFGRRGNSYCRPVIQLRGRTPTKVTMLNHIADGFYDKYRAVTLCNFGNGLQKSSRVEVRAFGNVDYSKKYQTIARYIKRIERLFNLSCRRGPLVRTFSV